MYLKKAAKYKNTQIYANRKSGLITTKWYKNFASFSSFVSLTDTLFSTLNKF